jgi:preprotein translocase subunit SecE
MGFKMDKNVTVAIFLVLMVIIIVSVDVLFFRHHILERLVSNIGIVLVFVALYFRFLK